MTTDMPPVTCPSPPLDAPGQERILDVEDLSVAFDGTTILTNINFGVPRGASLAIIGPNGAGKTVLLKALIGSVPSTGHIRWAPATRLGYVPQKLDLARDVPITGLDFLRARARIAHVPEGSIAEALAMVGLASKTVNLPIGTLSGGQFQRLLVAFALAGQPNVLLLDEPTAGVDEPGQERLNELVARLQRERQFTVLLVSHDLPVVHEFATAVLCLGRGLGQVCYGQPREVLTQDLLARLYRSRVQFHLHNDH
jgi:ABC-type Mn2+/Zn2+ transport system ATPase subunit